MLRLLALVLAATVPIHGRPYNNPVPAGFSDPGVIQLANTYYLVTSTNSSQPEKLPIYESPDLSSWRLVGYIFDQFNIPRWADAVQPFLAPRIYRIGNNYHVYFTATDLNTGLMSIGVAVAPHPAGPYLTNGQSLYFEPAAHVYDPAIIIDNKDIYLIWVADNTIKGRMLYPNGMSFYATYSTELIHSTSSSASLHGPVHTKLQGDHYLLYTQSDSSGEALQMASSSYALGPYDNKNTTFSDPSNDFEGIRHVSLISESNDRYNVLVYDAYRKNEVGPEFLRVIRMVSVTWENLLPNYRYNYGK